MVMPTYPGVYVEEVSSGVRPIQAASTSIAAFFGVAEKGDFEKPVKVYNFTEYQNLFGGFLNNSRFLSHAVFQFFNNGGSQCYIIRVGENLQTANINLRDRGQTPKTCLSIAASSPGVWGNSLMLWIKDGTNDPANEFDLEVYQEGTPAPLEVFKNLSMNPDGVNYIKNITAASKYIQVTVGDTSNAGFGTSTGKTPPSSLEGTTKTRFLININGDGFQEVDLADAKGNGAGQVATLDTPENIATAIIYVVKNKLKKLRESTDILAFNSFTCSTPDNANKVLVLTSGKQGPMSSITVAPALNSSQNATGLLKLGKLEGGVETTGSGEPRPVNTPVVNNQPVYYCVGDNATTSPNAAGVAFPIQSGSDGGQVTNGSFTNKFNLLDSIDDVSLIAVPGIGLPVVVGEALNYCANRTLSDCFFIGDMSVDDDSEPEAKVFLAAITPKNSYGAVYLPWIKMLDPTGKSPEPIKVPPSGYVAGLYAKTDAQRGVWKAPAGTAVALGGAVGLAKKFIDVEQGGLNEKNINVIRQFAESGIVLWGARTITSDREWTYIPVRRMAIFLRVSIYRGIQWAVFEPNDEELWSQLRLNIESFMIRLYRQGAFQGSTPSQAFFVKCDKETNPQEEIDAGIVNVLIGFAPLKPAEFVMVKISQKAGQSS